MGTIGDRIRVLIEDSNLRLRDFAARLGLPKNTLVNYRDNRTKPPSDVLERICTVFGVRAEWLLLGRGPMREGGDQEDTRQPTISDMDVLTSAIVLIEEQLAKRRASLPPDKKAAAIVLAYDILKSDPQGQDKVVRMLQLVA